MCSYIGMFNIRVCEVAGFDYTRYNRVPTEQVQSKGRLFPSFPLLF